MRAEPITTARLTLEPLTVEHAPEMVSVLSDDEMYTFIGGHPPDLDELTRRYARQAAGRSPDGSQGWLNWMVRQLESGELVGTVQATLHGDLTADVAWVIGVAHQGHGYATEATDAMVTWLRGSGVGVFRAYIHPRHDASAAVAVRLGMTPTADYVDGERVWRA